MLLRVFEQFPARSILFLCARSLSSFGGSIRTNFELDELKFLRRAYTLPAEFQISMTRAGRDTSKTAFAIFHFDDFGSTARSSVPLLIRNEPVEKPQIVPVLFALDSDA